MSEAKVRRAIKEIRKLQAKRDRWTEKNEDICGYDDATWFDTIAEFESQIADAGSRLADLVEQMIGAAE